MWHTPYKDTHYVIIHIFCWYFRSTNWLINTLKMFISWYILCWLAHIIIYAHCIILQICERTKWFPRIWLIKTLVCSKDQKLWSKKNRSVKSFQKHSLRGVYEKTVFWKFWKNFNKIKWIHFLLELQAKCLQHL